MQKHMQVQEMKYKYRYKQRHSWRWQDIKILKHRGRQRQTHEGCEYVKIKQSARYSTKKGTVGEHQKFANASQLAQDAKTFARDN